MKNKLNIEQIFKNANIQNICEFLVHGRGLSETDNRPYNIRLKESREKAVSKFKECFPKPLDYDHATDELDLYAAELQSVYMEIGFQTGLLVALQIAEKMTSGSHDNNQL